MGVKQGYLLSPTLFGLYTDGLEELITEYAKYEVIEGPTIGMHTLRILLYADVVIMMSHTCVGMNKMLEILKAFCDRSGMTVNVTKTKMMICSRGTKMSFSYDG